jgi:CHAD domain-containing protein
VIPVVVGSSPIGHPSFAPRKWRTPALGGRPSVRPAVAALFSAALAQVEVNARGVARFADPEFLHQLRVGLRRLRTVQRAFRLPGTKRRLRKFKPALAAARDWDVFCGWLENARVSPELKSLARRKRAAARRQAQHVLSSRAFDQFLRCAPRCVHETKASPLKALESFHRKALKKAQRIDWQDEEDRHALRIRIRRLRYACEFFAPFFPRTQYAAYLKRVKALQDLLGELNDIAVARRFLQEMKAEPLKQLQRREARLISVLGPAWAAFERSRTFWG